MVSGFVDVRAVFRAIVATVLCMGLYAAPSAHAQERYYISDGINVRLIHGPMAAARVSQWAAFYFKRGTDSNDLRNRWGIDTKSTPQAVMRSVEASQQFERNYEKWCGCGWGDNTFFSVLAPVAMVKPEGRDLSPRGKEVLNRAHEKWDELIELRDQINDAAEWIDAYLLFNRNRSRGAANPQFPVPEAAERFFQLETNARSGGIQVPLLPVGSSPFLEFLSAMNDTISRLQENREMIGRLPDNLLERLERNFDALGETEMRLARRWEPVGNSLRSPGHASISSPAARAIGGALTISGDMNKGFYQSGGTTPVPFTYSADGARVTIDIRDTHRGNTSVSVSMNDIDWEQVQWFPKYGDYIHLACREGKTCINGLVGGQQRSLNDLGPIHCGRQPELCKGFFEKLIAMGLRK